MVKMQVCWLASDMIMALKDASPHIPISPPLHNSHWCKRLPCDDYSQAAWARERQPAGMCLESGLKMPSTTEFPDAALSPTRAHRSICARSRLAGAGQQKAFVVSAPSPLPRSPQVLSSEPRCTKVLQGEEFRTSPPGMAVTLDDVS